jgi:hypothetical protein
MNVGTGRGTPYGLSNAAFAVADRAPEALSVAGAEFDARAPAAFCDGKLFDVR